MNVAALAEPSSIPASGDVLSRRLLSVDVLRGLCVAGMILVTNAGDWNHVYWPLQHATWNGVTPTDMIFPTFLFLAGVSMTYSFAARRKRGEPAARIAAHVVRRSALLIFLGLFLNCFDLLQLTDLRIPGVLQRIGLCYLCAGLLYLAFAGQPPVRLAIALIASMGVLVTLYWALQTLVPVPGYGAGRLEPVSTLSAFLDRAVFTTKHLWHWGGPGQVWDPEGLLSTLPAIANVLLGILSGVWLRTTGTQGRKVLGMGAAGIALMLVALALDPLIPINKKIWTPSFMFFSGGFSMVALAVLYGCLDLGAGLSGRGAQQPWRWAITPALVFGSNAIGGFALATIVSALVGLLRLPTPAGQTAGPGGFVVQHLLPWMSPWNASLAYAVLFVLLVLAMLWPLYQWRIFLRL